MTVDAGRSSSPNDPATALAALAAIPQQFDPALLLVAQAPGEPPELAATRPTDRLASAFRAVVLDHAEKWRDRELIPYGPSTTVADGQLMWIPASDVPMLATADIERDLADLPLFDPSPRFLRRLRLSALRVPAGGGYATLLRRLSPGQVLARSGKIPVIRRGDRMDLIDGDTILIDRQVDAIVVSGVALFTDRSAFQRVFGFLDDLRRQATQTFDAVAANLRIDGHEAMRAAVSGQPAMLGKMASIARKLREFPAYREAITMPRLVEFVLANPHTDVEITGKGASARLVFRADPQHRFKILKLLDDDYLQSHLTQLSYESNSKGMPLA